METISGVLLVNNMHVYGEGGCLRPQNFVKNLIPPGSWASTKAN